MEDQILDAPVLEKPALIYAGFWIRFAAYLIDYIVIMAAITVLSLLLFYADEESTSEPTLLYVFVFYGPYILYFIIMESSPWQATLGKKAVGIKVGNIHGERISFGHALGRFFAKIISGLPLCVGYMMAGWDSKKQALHDRVVNTYVFYG
jgi:uncharacterized RDD family membrane protein YckC